MENTENAENIFIEQQIAGQPKAEPPKEEHKKSASGDLGYDGEREGFLPDPSCAAEFHNVAFCCEHKKEKTYILKNFSAKLKKGAISAVASLRNTDFEPFVRMILRSYEFPKYMIERGSIAVNGENTTLLKRKDAERVLSKAFNIVAPAFGAGVLRRTPAADATVKDFVSGKFFLEFYELPELEKALKSVGFHDINSLYDTKYGELSISDMQRIKLAQDLCFKQDVAVVVYPGMGLNDESKYFLKRLMIDRLVAGTVKAVLLLGEDMEFIADCANEIYILENGEIVESGAKADIIETTQNPFIKSMLTRI